MDDKHLLHKPLENFIEEVSEPRPETPGAGSSAAVVAAMAASLLELIGQIALKERYRKKFARELVTEARQLRSKLLELAEADAKALQNMLTAKEGKMPAEALYIPQRIALLSLEICRLSKKASLFETRATLGDAVVAGYLAQSAVMAMAEIIRQNSSKLDDYELQNSLFDQSAAWVEEAREILHSYVVLH